MTAPGRIAVAVATSLLLTISSDAAAIRRRAVTMPAVQPPVPIAVSEEHRVTTPDVLAGAAGWAAAIASNGNATAIAWTSPEYDQTFVGIVTAGTTAAQFGTLLPDATNSIYNVKIAAGGDGFLVAWTTPAGIRTATLDDHGLTPGALIPAATATDMPRLQLASDGDRYLVGWQASSGQNSHYYGQLLDRTAHLIGVRFDLGPGACVYNGLLNGGGGSFVAVLALDNCLGESIHALYARSISHDGDLGPAENFGAGDVETGHSLTSNGSDYFVVWTPYPITGDRRISRISRQGHVAQTVASTQPIEVVGTTSEPVLLYYDTDPNNGCEVAAVHLNDQLQPTGAKAVLLPGCFQRVVSAGPGDVQIAYTSYQCDWCTFVVAAARWSPSSLSGGLQPALSRLREQRHPSIAAYRNGYAMAWEQEGDEGTAGRVVYSTGDASGWSTPKAVAGGTTIQRMPVIAAANDGFVIAWEDRDGGSGSSDIDALIVRADGTTTALQLFDKSYAPAIASDGTSFLAGASRGSRFATRRVSLNGEITAEVAVPVTGTGAAYAAPGLVAVGDEWLVAYDVNTFCRLGECLYAMFEQYLDTAGTPVGQPLPFNVSDAVRHAPHLAANGRRAQMIYWNAGALGTGTSNPPTVLTRQIAPGFSGPQTLANFEDSRYGRWVPESSAIAPFGSGFLAAWIAYDRQQVMLSSINGTPSAPLAVSGSLAVRYVDVATRNDEGLVVYTRRLTDSGFGSSLQLMVRAVGVAP